jgi:hypothetical protein
MGDADWRFVRLLTGGNVVSVSDILKLLDKWPLWKRLTALPDRVDALEARIAELEGKRAKSTWPGVCALCGERLRPISAEQPHPTFGEFGMKIVEMECSGCGKRSTREFDPAKQG